MKAVMAILAVMLVFTALFVWPTRYSYTETTYAGRPAASRTERLTGRTEQTTYGEMAIHRGTARMALVLDAGILIGLIAGLAIPRRRSADMTTRPERISG